MENNKKSKKKTALIISLSVLLIAGAVAGTTAILFSSKNKNNSVPFSDGIKFNNIDIQTLRDSFQNKINKNKYTIEQFSANLKNDVANILRSILNNNDANILVKEVVYNNNEIVITLNSEYEYTLLEKRDDVVLKTVQDINNENNKITTLTILDLNLKFFDNYTITNTLNLFNKLQEYISNNKDTIDEFNQKLLANNTTLVDLIKNNLFVDNGTNTQPIEENKIQNIQIVDNKIEITLESIDYLLYSISGNNNSSNISVKDNKIMISNLIFYKAITIDDTKLNALQNNIQNLINTNQYTLNDFTNQLSSLSFKNQISNYLNIASSEINTISFESGVLKITPNDNLKFVSATNNNLIIDYNIEITNLVFYNSIMLTKLSNLHSALNNYIAQQKLTVDAFANQANSNNTDILNLIKMNLYVLNNDAEQLIDENKILGFEFINNQFEIELEKSSLKYETNSVDSSIVVQNNKIII
ncbi:MAG: hypothetical protein K2K73_02250, partial [Ureaplasma sp.]|nr:hypothetical protein [Ureaplasma sp.]